jgi:hypothetical protein
MNTEGASMISDVHASRLTPTILSAKVTQVYQHWSTRPDEADAFATIGIALWYLWYQQYGDTLPVLRMGKQLIIDGGMSNRKRCLDPTFC